MTPQLLSIEQSPRSVPAWELIIDDLGRPPAERIATVLGVSRSTVYLCQQAGSGPRIACLALFWLTRWGRSAVHPQATNDAVLYVQLARALTDERDKLAHQFELLEREHRALQFDFATTQLAQPSRGNGATVGRFHMDRAPLGSSAAAVVPPGSMSWPELEPRHSWPDLPQALAFDQATGASPAGERPGTPEAPPPAERSAKSPVLARSPQPQPSAPREVLQSLPSPEPRCQSDAIVASPLTPPALTCFRCDKPTAPAPASGAASPRPWPSARGLEEASVGASRTAAARPAPAPTSTKSNTVLHGARVTTEATGGPAAREDGQRQPTTEGLLLSDGLRPISVAGREPALSWGNAPYPPPMAASAPPGQGVFAALVRAATGTPAPICFR